MLHPLLLTIRNLRHTLLARAHEQQPPMADAARKLMDLIPQLARADLNDQQVALVWGELQLILVEGEGAPQDATLWGQVRNAADAAMVGLLKRKEWAGLEDIFRKDLFFRLAAAVTATRARRMQSCIEVTSRLRTLAERPSGLPQRWLLLKVAGMQYPRFGTSGWRARMGVDFSWHRATAVAQAIAEYVKQSGLAGWPLTIGYDSRINADKVAQLVAEVAAANGLTVHLVNRETPSPALIHYITEELGAGANAGLINCTPSHNPVRDPDQRLYLGTEYHGIRYNMPYGGVAPQRATDAIGLRAMELLLEEDILPVEVPRGHVSYIDPLPRYTDALLRDLSAPVILSDGTAGQARDALVRHWGADDAMIVIDEMHSASRGYLRRVCDMLGLRYTVIHGEKDPLLGNLLYANPERPHTADLQRTVQEMRARYPRIIGIGFDTDSDRFGVVDEDGQYVMMNQLLPMLADYLLTLAYTGQPGRIIRNMVTTRQLDRVAVMHADKIIPPTDTAAIVPHAAGPEYRVMLGDPHLQSGFQTWVVPVGFKYIADIMMADLIAADARGEQDPRKLQQLFHACLAQVLIAGEESNGMTSRGHAPDKDGIWGAVLTLQMCAVHGQPLADIRAAIWERYGRLVSVRRDVQAPDAAKTALVNHYLAHFADMAAEGAYPEDALAHLTPFYCGGVSDELVEVILHDTHQRESYLTVRASGTEPIIRIYVESPDDGLRDTLLASVGEELERLIVHEIETAPDVDSVVELLASVELPAADGANMPATFTERIIAPARARLHALTGDEKQGVAQADRALAELAPAKAGTLCQR